MTTKIVECIDCYTEVEVSKFASARLTRCPDCKANAIGSTGNRKRTANPVKGTKQWAIDDFRKEEGTSEMMDPAIDRAVEDGLVKSGFKVVYRTHDQYAWKWMYGLLENDETCKLYGTGRKKATVWNYRYWSARLHETREKAFEALEAVGARFTWDEWLAGRHGVIGERGADELIVRTMQDEIACLMADGDESESIAIASIFDNMHDEYCDYCRKHGFERMY